MLETPLEATCKSLFFTSLSENSKKYITVLYNILYYISHLFPLVQNTWEEGADFNTLKAEADLHCD